MRIRVTGCRSGTRCPCGALAVDGAFSCEKCAARHRWIRRKSWRRRDDS